MFIVRSLKPLPHQHSYFSFYKTLFNPQTELLLAVSNSKIFQNRFHLLLHFFFNHSQFLIPVMALIIKHPHNYLCVFEKTDKNTDFHSIIDILSTFKYKTLLTVDAPIYHDILHDFWANATIEEQGNEPFGITSKVGGVSVAITPTTISKTFQMNDLAGKTSFLKMSFKQI
ncbi:hypothetical protein Hanom_Chr15g01380091 [Helianthus anomalus]